MSIKAKNPIVRAMKPLIRIFVPLAISAAILHAQTPAADQAAVAFKVAKTKLDDKYDAPDGQETGRQGENGQGIP